MNTSQVNHSSKRNSPTHFLAYSVRQDTSVRVYTLLSSAFSLSSHDPALRPTRGLSGMDEATKIRNDARTPPPFTGSDRVKRTFWQGSGTPARYLTPKFALSSFNLGGQWKMIQPWVGGSTGWHTPVTADLWRQKITIRLYCAWYTIGYDSAGKTRAQNTQHMKQNRRHTTGRQSTWTQYTWTKIWTTWLSLYEIKQQHLIPCNNASVRNKALGSASAVPCRRTVSRGTGSRFEELSGGEADHFHPHSGTRPSWPPP